MPRVALSRVIMTEASGQAVKRMIAFRLLRLTLLPLLLREVVQRRNVTILFYHDPSPETLRTHLDFLKRRYTLISLRRAIDAYHSQALDALPRKPLVVTLDDGHAGNFHLRPLLEERNVPVTIFLCSGIIGSKRRFWFKHAPEDVESMKRIPDADRLAQLRAAGFDEESETLARDALSKHEIQELSPFVDFQSHTVSHPVLPLCSDEKARREIFESRDTLERQLGTKVYALSYPNGDYSAREISLARHAGYECALTADAGFNTERTDLFRLKRICIDDNDDIDQLAVKACGLWAYVKPLVHSNRIRARRWSGLGVRAR